VMALVVAPLIFVMIFKSERKQAKFSYQYGMAQKELVRIVFDKASAGDNFKLVSGSGDVVCEEPLIDELFGLRIQNALRIQRTVELIGYERKREGPTGP